MMIYKKATLADMLLCKDRRAYIQTEMIKKYKSTLICLTLNIPGEYKASDEIKSVFDIAKNRIKASLNDKKIDIVKEYEINEFTGFELYFAVKNDAVNIKNICVEIENQDRLSRLFDIDIFDENYNKIDRNFLNQPTRKCLVCNKEAKGCARSRAHSLEELQNIITNLIKEYI